MGKSESHWKALAGWFERQKRVLPWRDQPTLYRVWISEIMLQQTQVVTVVPYFERFLGRFPNVEALAAAPQEDVLLHWAGLGYYSRARNLHRAAQMIVERGGFPRIREEWLEIPGVGNYTAGAILSIALDLPEAILDGNVERVLSRVHRLARESGDAHYKEALWQRSREAVESAHAQRIRPSVLNQALMELGATYCSPKKPKCLLCPLAPSCGAHAGGVEEQYPPRKKPKQWVAVEEELHCMLDEQGRVLLRQRASGEWRAGLWDLLDQKPKGEFLGVVETKHVVTRHKISRKTHVWLARPAAAANPARKLRVAESPAATAPNAPAPERWISIASPEVPVGSALKRTLRSVLERFPAITLSSD